MDSGKGRKLLFVGGDLSGIQDFLYNITTSKAAVSLKGRSKYLEEYLQGVLRELLGSPGVVAYDGEGIKGGVVYDSGGKFSAVVEDSAEARQAIGELARREERRLWEQHYGQLSVCIVQVPFEFTSTGGIRVEGGEEERLGTLWRAANMGFARHKAQKFRTVIDDAYDELFQPQGGGGQTRVCAVTGIESERCVALGRCEDGSTIYVLPSVKEQIERGQALQRQEGGKSFEEYAGGSRLGVLRMDVDGLGTVFSEGFATFGDYARFSAQLVGFFKQRLTEIVRGAEFRNYVCVVYAGGDDLFAVGRWDKVIGFAHEVREAFVRHINRKGVTMSGGMVVVDVNFPIAKAAELSGEAENEAKKFGGGQKNAFCMLGQSLSWEGEFGVVKRWADKMVEQCRKGDLPRSILHRLMTLNAMRQNGNPAALWETAYYLTRFAKDKQSAAPFCNDMKCFLNEPAKSKRNYALAALAARWAELLLRETEQKETNIKTAEI